MRWFVLLIFLSGSCAAQDIAALMNRGAALEAGFREPEALAAYQQVVKIQAQSVLALCRCSDLSCRIGNRESDRGKKIVLFQEGLNYAQSAYRIDSLNSEVNIAMAFSLARMALIQSGRERVASAREIKRYAEQALRADPGSYKAWHILGRWNYEVSNLSGLERMLARWFYGALPDASLGEAVRDFEKSKALNPGFLLNYYELARAYRREGRNAQAIASLVGMDGISDAMYDDRTVRQRGRELLAQLK